MPPPCQLAGGGTMFSTCPFVHPSVHLLIRLLPHL